MENQGADLKRTDWKDQDLKIGTNMDQPADLELQQQQQKQNFEGG